MAKRTAGAFDIRNIIAMLLGAYGIVLVVMGLVSADDQDLDKADGLNINLWGGAGMLVVAAAMVAWSIIKPVVVPDDVETGDGNATVSKPSGAGQDPR